MHSREALESPERDTRDGGRRVWGFVLLCCFLLFFLGIRLTLNVTSRAVTVEVGFPRLKGWVNLASRDSGLFALRNEERALTQERPEACVVVVQLGKEQQERCIKGNLRQGSLWRW